MSSNKMSGSIPSSTGITRFSPATAASTAVAVALHVIIIYGLGFALEPPKMPAQTMEITLATFATDKTPDKADYLAQENQQGSGTLDEKARPSSDMPAPYQDNKLRNVQLEQQTAALPETTASKATRVTSTKGERKVASADVQQKENPVESAEVPRKRIDLSSEIASLEADFFQQRQEYAKKPVVHRINTASTRKADVYYQEAWRRKVMRVGQINYPAVARQNKIYGELRVAVQIHRDGSLRNVEILRSSGHDILDNAALRIVRMSAPFTPFPPELKGYDVIEIIRTWRFEPGDLFSG
ncbi:energy transducer TonB [Parendozoicomonas haliclonae]|uniref:Transport protein TonB n=1 Tax=Parendozoicomonas haliclonae TaxID=1960125 RepID=A0A1X7AJ42_9GAMM|nr:energy transducer TonB [Parendozoicomonas haliclonae]SMA46108.1 transport protein TonB [Parendozoicomonas haliclonae]